MTRRELRENTFKMLFIKEFHDIEDMEEQYNLFVGEIDNMEDDDKNFIHERVFRIIPLINELDSAIDQVAEGWKTTRMGRVELTILRLALFEIRFDEEIPDAVAINEAVELAKKYGGEDSSSFINGVLAKLVA